MNNKKIKASTKKKITDQPNQENFSFIKKGEIVEARVVSKGRKIIYFDLGPYGLGICYKSEFFDLPQDMKEIQEDKPSLTKVLNPENRDGYVELSLRRAAEEKSWDYIQHKMESGEDITVRVTGANRGGLLTRVRSIDAFLPASQLSKGNYPDFGGDKDKILKELKNFIGKDLKVRIVDIEKDEKKLILSERADEIEEIKEKVQKYEVGDTIEGKICGIVDYGAFVEFGKGLEGLVHISEIDWQLIDDPRDYLSVGDKIKAKIIRLKGDQVSLSVKALKRDPWLDVKKKYKRGDIVKAVVAKMSPHGVFVKLDEKIQGLVPISKVPRKGNTPLFEEGKAYKFKIFSLNVLRHRMALVPARNEEVKPEKKQSKNTHSEKNTTKAQKDNKAIKKTGKNLKKNRKLLKK
jgi:small subunit ribosomal protein S1